MKKSFFNMELLILSSLLEQDRYGYEIASIILTRSSNIIDIKEGALYPILSRLKENGYVSNYEEIVNKRIRVYYHIEPSGIFMFNELKIEFYEKYKAVDNVLKGIVLNENKH